MPVTTSVSVATNNANPVPMKETNVTQYQKCTEISMKANKFPYRCILIHALILVGRRCFKTTYIGVTTAIHSPPVQATQWVNRSEPTEKLNEDLSTIMRAERIIVKRIMTEALQRSKSFKCDTTLANFTLELL
ncbi:MAG TPA: hypothetical protein VLU95_02330 [Candidatus Acidoferrum sp.]|nr:hypothetical protein [Candidatus Acidoferrum sp.]